MTDTLTPRQKDVAALVAEAWTNKRIAAQLHISERRVQSIISTIAAKLGADTERDDRVQIARAWITTNAA